MKMMKKLIPICLFVILLLPVTSKAQSKNSVYSMFGVGQIIDNSFGINKSLGGTGIAFQSGRTINHMNPAGYLGILPSSFMMETGAYGIYNQYESDNETKSSGNINASYFAAALYMKNWWAMSFGITPFSYVDYEIYTTTNMQGESSAITQKFTGSGSLNRAYWGNSFKIYKGLAAGFNASYIFGPIEQSEIAESGTSFTGYELANKRTVYGFYSDYGLQYCHEINNWLYSMGMVFGLGKDLNAIDNMELTYEDETITIEEDEDVKLTIPAKFGLGISVRNSGGFRAGFDYQWKNWSAIDLSDKDYKVQDSNRYSVGIEYSPYKTLKDNLFKRLVYRVGANYKNTYLQVDNTEVNSAAVNVGIGIPWNRINILNLALEYGQEGTLNRGMIKDNYFQVYLNLTIHDFWNVRKR